MCNPNDIDDLKVKLQKRRLLQRERDVEAASGSTMSEPWPKPVNGSQKSPYVPARRALHPVPQFPCLSFPGPKEDSVRDPRRAAGHLGRNSSQTSDRVSTTKRANQVRERFGKSDASSPFVCALATTTATQVS